MSTGVNTAKLARDHDISRSSLYYTPKKQDQDEQAKHQIIAVMQDHPAYGHKRIALHLGWNKKKVRRIMKLFQLKPRITRSKKLVKPADLNTPPTAVPNLLNTRCPIAPHAAWAGDFTYISFQGQFIYLATVMDIYTRNIIGWHIGLHHTTNLVMQAFQDAINRTRAAPQLFHSDQGSEYKSYEYERLLKQYSALPSHSMKSSPWENAYQESFYNNFKLELGNPNKFQDLGELIAAIHTQIHYYNTRRIHTALKMPPVVFAQQYKQHQEQHMLQHTVAAY